MTSVWATRQLTVRRAMDSVESGSRPALAREQSGTGSRRSPAIGAGGVGGYREMPTPAGANAKRYAEQLTRIADRLTPIATSGSLAEREREVAQVQQAGRLLADAITKHWLGVGQEFRCWVADVGASKPGGPTRPPLLDPHVQVFLIYVDTFFLHGEDPLVREEPRGLSHLNTARRSTEEVAAILGGRLTTVADACRAIAGEMMLPAPILLLDAVNGLHSSTFQWRSFEKVTVARRKLSASTTNMLNALARIKPAEAMSAAALPPTEAVAPAFIEHLHRVRRDGLVACDRARIAIRLGGAKALDDALSPGSSQKSVALGVKVREAEAVFSGLGITLQMPAAVFDDSVEKMKQLCDWFGDAHTELGTVLEQPERSPPADDGSRVDRWYSAAWYNRATKGALYPDLLRVAWKDKRITGRKPSGRRQYSLQSVINQYEDYRAMLERADAKEPEAKRRKPKKA